MKRLAGKLLCWLGVHRPAYGYTKGFGISKICVRCEFLIGRGWIRGRR